MAFGDINVKPEPRILDTCQVSSSNSESRKLFRGGATGPQPSSNNRATKNRSRDRERGKKNARVKSPDTKPTHDLSHVTIFRSRRARERKHVTIFTGWRVGRGVLPVCVSAGAISPFRPARTGHKPDVSKPVADSGGRFTACTQAGAPCVASCTISHLGRNGGQWQQLGLVVNNCTIGPRQPNFIVIAWPKGSPQAANAARNCRYVKFGADLLVSTHTNFGPTFAMLGPIFGDSSANSPIYDHRVQVPKLRKPTGISTSSSSRGCPSFAN